MVQDAGLLRPSDIAYNGGDASRAKALLDWQARYRMPDVVRLMVAAERDGLDLGARSEH